MNRIIMPYRFVKNKDIEDAIRRMLSQLEHNNYAVISNPDAIRSFSRTIPSYYREKGIILFSSTKGKNIVILDPSYEFYQKGLKKYQIRPKTEYVEKPMFSML